VVALPFALRPKRPALAPADDTLVIITGNNEATRFEFGIGFRDWYRARTGRTISLDWRVIGGTNDIARFLDAAYTNAFELRWTRDLGKSWSGEIQAAFANARLAVDASPQARAARAAFLASDVGCGADLFFGGGSFDFIRQATAGRIVPSRVVRTHPEWFNDAVVPQFFTGEQYWAADGTWVGNVASTYGMIVNRDALARLGVPAPREWDDLADPRYVGELALSDATKSTSMLKAFEIIIQQNIRRQLARAELGDPSNAAAEAAVEARGVRAGWVAGLQLVQRLAANARYFTDSSQKPPIDVASGDCAAGIGIDFYGRAQADAVARRGDSRVAFISPRSGTVSAVDPIALLRGAPHREAAELFIEYTLTLEAQKLWNFRPGTPGGPMRYALRRLPVRKDFYQHDEWKQYRSDPDAAPYAEKDPLIYHPAWTAGLFTELAFVIRVMCIDSHLELVRAWRAIQAAPEPARARALARVQDLAAVDYAQVNGAIRATLASKNKVDEVKLARELGAQFRRQYAEAEAIARGK